MKLVAGSLFFLLMSTTGFSQETAVVDDTVSIENQFDTTAVVLIADTVSPALNSKPKANGEEIDALISYAKTFLGTPYHYAGTSPSGFDCSGFIYYVFGNFGFDVTRTSYGLAELGQTVKLADLRPGDLMFFKGRNINSTSVGHVSLVVEVSDTEIKMIHASSSRGVVIDNFKTSKYYIPRFIKAKRLDYGAQD